VYISNIRKKPTTIYHIILATHFTTSLLSSSLLASDLLTLSFISSLEEIHLGSSAAENVNLLRPPPTPAPAAFLPLFPLFLRTSPASSAPSIFPVAIAKITAITAPATSTAPPPAPAPAPAPGAARPPVLNESGFAPAASSSSSRARRGFEFPLPPRLILLV
jgi:hypothetical protein